LEITMKAGIHPAYEEVNVICACGHKFRTRSSHKGDIRVEICSNCHPFFTGRQKLIDTEGRVDRFQKKYQKVRDAQAAEKVAAATAKEAAKDAAKKQQPVA
jgi:large subunit ribosomal protein L31